MARLGLRKNEVRLLRRRDVDLDRGELRVPGEGGKIADVPIVYEDVLADLARLALESGARPEKYLLSPSGSAMGAPTQPEGSRARASRPADAALDDAPLVQALPAPAGAAGFPMHELRHTAGTSFVARPVISS
jgi:integrase